jgi:hypothetical protein
MRQIKRTSDALVSSARHGFIFALGVFRSLGNGALERLDQLGDGGEDRAVIGGERGVAGTLRHPRL